RVESSVLTFDVTGLLFQLHGLNDPFLMILLFDERKELCQEFLYVGGHAYVYQDILIELAGINIYLYLISFSGELLRVESDSVAEPGSQCQHQVGSVDCLIGGDAAVHADEAQISWIFIADDTSGHERICG